MTVSEDDYYYSTRPNSHLRNPPESPTSGTHKTAPSTTIPKQCNMKLFASSFGTGLALEVKKKKKPSLAMM